VSEILVAKVAPHGRTGASAGGKIERVSAFCARASLRGIEYSGSQRASLIDDIGAI